MLIWRLSRFETLDGSGGIYASARWHTQGRRIVYCAPNPATALLELLVHSEVREPRALVGFLFLEIEVPDDVRPERVEAHSLPADWPTRVDVTRAWGDRWLAEGRSLLLEVPCVIVPETHNVLINPQHREFSRVRIVASCPTRLTRV